MSIIEEQQKIISEFQTVNDWSERYKKIIAMGEKLPPMDENLKNDENKVRGCQSNVWLHAKLENGLIYFTADSDAAIVKGLIAILMRIFSGRTPSQIIGAPVEFISMLGLNTHLSQTRANGLIAMIKQIQYYAIALNRT